MTLTRSFRCWVPLRVHVMFWPIKLSVNLSTRMDIYQFSGWVLVFILSNWGFEETACKLVRYWIAQGLGCTHLKHSWKPSQAKLLGLAMLYHATLLVISMILIKRKTLILDMLSYILLLTGRTVSWTCSQVKLKTPDGYTENEGAILLLLFFQFVILVLLALAVRFCCIFWRKRKLQDRGLVEFLEKKKSLHNKGKTFNRMITELEQKATEESATNEALEQLGKIVKAKEGVERKLSPCYSTGK